MFRFGCGGENNEITVSLVGKSSDSIYLFSVFFIRGGWLRGSIAIPLFIAFAYVCYKRYFQNRSKEETDIVIDKGVFLLVLAGITVWLAASGIGGFCMQSGDWHKHNAILHDLIDYDWPVKYSLPEGDEGLLSYYIFSYLFPALIGKVAGFRWAELAMLFQSIAGVLLVYLYLCHFLNMKEKRKQLFLFGLLVVFGGAVLAGKAVYGYFRPEDVSASFHWFSNTIQIQFSSHIVLMRWVFPQAIVPWLATLLFLEDPKKVEDFAWTGLPIFMYSCFSFIGLLPFYIGMALYRIGKERNFRGLCKQAFSIQNMYALFGVLPVFIMYIAGNVFQEKPEIVSLHGIDYSGNWILYVSFCLSNFLLWSFFIWKQERSNPVFYIANIVLLALPLFWYGAYNDLCMRSCIPAFFVIAVSFYKYILNVSITEKSRNLYVLAALCFLLVAAFPQTKELYENARFFSVEGAYRADGWGTLENQLVRDGTNDRVAYNYVAYDCGNSFFIKYMARRTGDGK